MKKLKEIFKIIKELWANKKTRAWVWLGFYFVFFLVLSILMRMEPSSNLTPTPIDKETNYNIEAIKENLNNLLDKDYTYKMYIQDELLLGKVENNSNSFTYQENKYIFVNNKLYLEDNYNLQLIENFLDSEIPTEFINIDKIITVIKNKDYSSDSIIQENFNIIYNISTLDFLDIVSDDKISIRITGNKNIVKKIIVTYKNNDYILEIF